MKHMVKMALLGSCLGLCLVAGLNAAGPATTGPKARYNMDVGTMTGFAAMGRGIGGGMSMMFGGGGNKVAHELNLRLGSSLSPDKGGPKADHFPNPGLKAGKALPLTTSSSAPRDDMPENFERPKGRLLIFWGCGARAPKGQPVIIDFAKVAQGQMPAGLFSARIPVDRGPRPSNSRTYGEWPNGKSGKALSGDASLLGEHRVAGNYTPDMKFTLNQDFMGPINGRATSLGGGVTTLSWNTVPGATGYHAWVMGMKMDQSRNSLGDMVWWSSSSAKEFGGGLWDWLSPATVQSLVAQKIVMPSGQTSCTVPAEVKAAAPDMMMGNLYAYGPEVNVSYPPKPASGVWNIDWTARIRYRSTTTWMIGGPAGMGGMSGADGQDKPRCKPSVFGAVLGKGC